MQFSSAEEYLIEADPILGAIIANNGHLPARPKRDNYPSLIRSIIGQQISVKAASKIYLRYEQATGLQPKAALALSEEQTKAIGLSQRKAAYLADLAQHYFDNPQVFDHLDSLSDEAVIRELTSIKGVGVWTAQMFLMFTLSRPDIFAPGDRGLQLAIERAYEMPARASEVQLVSIAEPWRPHRSTASLHLWQSLANMP